MDRAVIPELAIGPTPDIELDGLDYAIAGTLRFKARRPMRDVVRSLGAPAQMVRRRLERLTANDERN